MASARLGVVVALLSVSLMSRQGDAQIPAPIKFAGRIVGVYDDRTGNPLDSVEVRDLTTKSFALTTSTGTLSLFFVDSAGGLLRFRKLGYTPVTMFVDNTPDDAPLTITLEPIAQRLPLVVTKDSATPYVGPGLRGFEERRRSGGGGSFISEATLRANDDRTLGNIIRAHVAGLSLAESARIGSSIADIAFTKREGQVCQVDVYLDGVPVSVRSTSGVRTAIPLPKPKSGDPVAVDRASNFPTNDLRSFDPKSLAGVEYYSAATTPAQFNRTGSGCGVLLLWTRER